MSQQNNEKCTLPDYPRAPPLNEMDDNVMMSRPAPPTYEESQKHQKMQQFPQQFSEPNVAYAAHYNSTYAYASQQMYPTPFVPSGAPYVSMAGPSQSYVMGASQQLPVLTLAQGAELRFARDGAASIPPPPPGYAPTPAQWAAMQGQQVLVKEPKKRSFFS